MYFSFEPCPQLSSTVSSHDRLEQQDCFEKCNLIKVFSKRLFCNFTNVLESVLKEMTQGAPKVNDNNKGGKAEDVQIKSCKIIVSDAEKCSEK